MSLVLPRFIEEAKKIKAGEVYRMPKLKTSALEVQRARAEMLRIDLQNLDQSVDWSINETDEHFAFRAEIK